MVLFIITLLPPSYRSQLNLNSISTNHLNMKTKLKTLLRPALITMVMAFLSMGLQAQKLSNIQAGSVAAPAKRLMANLQNGTMNGRLTTKALCFIIPYQMIMKIFISR